MENGNTSTNSGGAAADRTSPMNQPATSQSDGTATVSHPAPQADSPSSSTPLTLDQVRAAIPEHGITLHDLNMLFKPYQPGFKEIVHFLNLVLKAGKRDPATKLITPNWESETSKENIAAKWQFDRTVVDSHPGAQADGPTSSFPLTVEQIKAAVPEHGISPGELHSFFKTQLGSKGPLDFVRLLNQAGKYDPATQLFMPRKKSSTAHWNTPTTSQPNSTAAAFYSGAQVDGLAPVVPLTLEEVKAAIPKEGIVLGDLVRIFKHRVNGEKATSHFIELVRKSGKQDAVTKLIVPKEETESLVEREA